MSKERGYEEGSLSVVEKKGRGKGGRIRVES
jgi:hypothetical protein